MTAQRQRPALLWPVLLLGGLGNLLFRTEHVGLNLGLWMLTAAALWYGYRRQSGDTSEMEWALLAGCVVLAASWAWRANAMLLLLNGIGLLVVVALLPLAAEPERARALADLTVGRLGRSLLALGGRAGAGALPVLLETQSSRSAPGAGTWAAPAVRGTLLAAPMVLLFGALLGAADPVFGDFLTGLVRFDPAWLASHLLGTLAAAWAGAALLRGAIPGASHWILAPGQPRTRGLGPIEVALAVGLVDLLFAGFIAFQLPYLFGGAAWVERTAGVTLAAYARRGFFELVTLSALVLPLLLVTASRLDPASQAAKRIFRSLASMQVLLMLSIMGSAAHRMALYQAEFGLTEDRFFASAFMVGLAVTALWFLVTVLRHRPALFTRGALLSWGTWLLVLNASNPERIIVETNLERYAAGRAFDVSYHMRLGPDAVPTLVAALPRLPAAERHRLQAALHDRFLQNAAVDWREWHLARARARAAVLPLTISSSQ
jgi:hypothetical protein